MWRFLQVSDPHLASQRDGQWNNRFLCTMMPDVMACLARDVASLAVDFALITGDIASHQSREAMLEARDLLELLQLPYYPMGGNHDFVGEDSRNWFLEAFEDRLPRPETFYAFQHKNLRFCVLDPWWVWQDGSLNPVSEASVAEDLDSRLDHARWAVPPHQLTWLRQELESAPKTPTVIGCHYPAVPIPNRMKRPGYKDSGALENGPLLLDLLAHFPQVCAIFSGHMHMHYIEASHGLTQIVTGALPEFPTEYREITVHEDHLAIRTLGLSDPRFAQRSLMAGKDWTEGENKDREALIPFNKLA